MLSMLGKNFSRQHSEIDLLIFHAVSLRDILYKMTMPIFGKNKKNINLSFAEIALIGGKVKNYCVLIIIHYQQVYHNIYLNS